MRRVPSSGSACGARRAVRASGRPRRSGRCRGDARWVLMSADRGPRLFRATRGHRRRGRGGGGRRGRGPRSRVGARAGRGGPREGGRRGYARPPSTRVAGAKDGILRHSCRRRRRRLRLRRHVWDGPGRARDLYRGRGRVRAGAGRRGSENTCGTGGDWGTRSGWRTVSSTTSTTAVLDRCKTWGSWTSGTEGAASRGSSIPGRET